MDLGVVGDRPYSRHRQNDKAISAPFCNFCEDRKEMILNNLLTDDVIMTITRDGLYSLTSIHRYAVLKQIADKNRHRPSVFIRDNKKIIDEFVRNGEKIKSVKGGKSATYASLAILMRYIAWIDVTYEYSVYSSAAYSNNKVKI